MPLPLRNSRDIIPLHPHGKSQQHILYDTRRDSHGGTIDGMFEKRYPISAHFLLRVINDEKKEIYGYVPAIDAQSLTVGDIISRIRNHGSADFIPNFRSSFAGVVNVADKAELALFEAMSDTYVKDIALGDLACDTPDASRQN